MLKANYILSAIFLGSIATPAVATDADSYRTKCSVDRGNVQVAVETESVTVDLDGKFVVNVFDVQGNTYTKHKLDEGDVIPEHTSKVIWQQFVGYSADRCEVNWKSSLTARVERAPAQVVVHHVPEYAYPRTQIIVHKTHYPRSRRIRHHRRHRRDHGHVHRAITTDPKRSVSISVQEIES